MRDVRALGWLTADLIRRFFREPQIVRSLLWPIALVPLTLMLTVLGFVWLEGNWPLAVDPQTPPRVVAALEARGFPVVPTPNPRQAVADGRFRYGTDGDTLYAAHAAGRALQIERTLRLEKAASWMVAEGTAPTANDEQGAKVMGVIGVIFVLFGVVFGAGMVARDRDDGTLEAQLAVGVGRWVHGAARLIAAWIVLAVHYLLGILVMHAVMGIVDPAEVARHGFAACAGGVSIGIGVIGRGGLSSGFSGPLAGGLTAIGLLAGIGLIAPGIGSWLPVSSLLAGGDGWAPLLGAALIATAVVGVFTVRSARS